MMKTLILFFALCACQLVTVTANAQRANYTEDDIIIMKGQGDACLTIMKLLEEKKIDSALLYFNTKDPATKKKVESNLKEIASAIQKYKGIYTLEVSPDAPDEKENYYYCKYTTDEGVTVIYKVTFIYDRYDRDYKVNKIIMPKK